jgi:hypothetical protein
MINGKGWYLWKLSDPLVEPPDVHAKILAESGFTHVLPKIADGTLTYNADAIKEYIAAWHKQGLLVIGWQYYYGKWPVQEGLRAVERIRSLDLDGFVIDAEREAKQSGDAAANEYLRTLGPQDIPVGLSSYRWPSLHRELAWDLFMSFCDYAMPQVYWVGAQNPKEQLERCVREYKARWPDKPIIPTGAAYHENSWQPQLSEIVEFAEAVKDLGMTGYNFWEFANAIRYGLYNTVATLDPIGLPNKPTTPSKVTMRAKETYIRSAPWVGGDTIMGRLRRGVSGPILEEQVKGQVRWVKLAVECWVAAEYYGIDLAEVE